MPNYAPTFANHNSNIPLPPSTTRNNFSFPNDLVVNGRNFCTTINFVSYQSTTAIVGSIIGAIQSVMGGAFMPAGSITLPIPKKLNDVQTVTWQQQSMTDIALGGASALASAAGAGGAASALGGLASALGPMTGLAMNPQLWMTFKNPEFKEHILSWTFAPNNEQESNTIANIINYFKYNMLPSSTAGLVYTYPNIAMISLHPNDFFTFRFKPCAVTSVQVDHTGAGQPSFFRNGAPTVVNLQVSLKEIELWTKDNYNT